MSANTRAMVTELKNNQEDFEWYPTTDAMIDTIKDHILNGDTSNGAFTRNSVNFHHAEKGADIDVSVLDCGAGDGRVLSQLTVGKKYAIEKARPLLQVMDRDIIIAGTEFMQQTLIDKSVQIIFSNPPYSCYSLWSVKIIKEAQADSIYLIIPKRWKTNEAIEAALKDRNAKAEIIGSFDFHDAERSARAEVDILHISLHRSGCAFNTWFNENFDMSDSGSRSALDRMKAKSAEEGESKSSRSNRLVVSDGQLAPVLVSLYNEDMTELMEGYKAISDIPSRLLSHLEVEVRTIKDKFASQIKGLKNLYWQELFDNLDRITDRLTTKKRKDMLALMNTRTSVDFTLDNIFAIVDWVLKNSTQYYDDQLISVMESLVEESSIINYKSNARTWGENDWRYNSPPDNLTHYKLELRIVTNLSAAIYVGNWSHNDQNGLCDSCVDRLKDLRTVCSNLGFDVKGMDGILDVGEWEAGKKKMFYYNDNKQQKPLFEIRAFKNGNLHIKFGTNVIQRLNVEFGRLKGWISNPEHAAQELNLSPQEVTAAWRCNLSCLPAARLMALVFDSSAASASPKTPTSSQAELELVP